FDIYINQNKVSKRQITNNVPINPFGSYYDLYSVEFANLELVIPIEKYYYANINLENKHEYDKGVVLNFSGRGYLNDEEISNYYKNDEVGKYVLEVVGNNDDKKIINFIISDLSIDPIVQESNNETSFEIQVENPINQNNIKLNLVNNLQP